MKENELRIGNLIKISETGTIITVTGIMQNSHGIKVFGITSDGTYCNPWIEYCEPISLTEEWLLKFGFKILNGFDDAIIWVKDYVELEYVTRNSTTAYVNYINNECNHVHQLQNLYFALTGEELTINTDNHDTEGKD